jgi:hypothetical protein
MKRSLFAVTLLALLLMGSRDLRAQAYGPFFDPYWDFQYQQYLQYQHYLQWQEYLRYLQLHDPYYELHVMHYQLYRQPYQPYLAYPSCCYAVGIPVWSEPVRPVPRREIGARRPFVMTPRSQAAVAPLPRAVAPLPPAVGPVPRATGRR